LQPGAAGCRFRFSRRCFGILSVSWIDQNGHTSDCGHQFTQKAQPFRRQLATEEIDSGQVAVRPGEAGDETKPDRVIGDDEDDGNRRGCRL
jgi:hypothetical protein